MVVLAKNFKISLAQYRLLSRGLSFIPTPSLGKTQRLDFEFDIQNYHRKIKLAAYFGDDNNRVIPPFVGPSDWSPDLQILPPEIRFLIRQDLESFEKYFKPSIEENNLSIPERIALQELRNYKHIVIKAADKGSAVVVLSREQYIFEVERQLNDTEYYKKLDRPIFWDTVPMVAEILDKLQKKKFITAKQKKYLLGNLEPRERRFYILPKIHKSPEKWTIPFELPPGRPIVSDCGSETYFTAEYLDYYLNPLSVHHPSYVKDTYNFIDIVKNIKISSDFFFFSMDVEALYTNIPIKAGIDCVKQIFTEYPDPKRPDEELLKLLEINLTRNDFMFNDKFYLQIKGTAMGKKFAPAYANIFMAHWEKKALANCNKKPEQYLRYLDDIWGIWSGTEAEFDEFVKILNAQDSSIRLSVETNRDSIDFLDTTVFKGTDFTETNKLEIKVYFKSTDTHALLHRGSFHPRHTFFGLVKSQLLRFNRICTKEENFLEAVKILFKALRKRGYSRTYLRRCFRTYQQERSREDSTKLLPLITTYSTIGTIMNRKLKRNFQDILGQAEMLPNSKIISAYRRNRNLRDLLVQAKLPLLVLTKPLLIEKQFIRLVHIKNARNGNIVKIHQSFSPRSENCVYVIFCSKCGIKYIGETKNNLSTRMYQHRYNVKNKKNVDTPFVGHFIKHGWSTAKMAGLEKNVSWTDWERKKKERFWIFLLGTREPFGLNLKQN